MSAEISLSTARWLLRRVLLTLLLALALAVVTRQFVDGGGDGGAATASPTATVTGPRIGDHWHATYEIVVCGVSQPPVPQWLGGVHTHSDGLIHIHPLIPSEQGPGARLVKWFEYGGDLLTRTEVRIPGTGENHRNGDRCPGGAEAALRVSANGEPLDDWTDYIPQDGDSIRIVFGPEEGG